jgi:hypothetical protein
MKLTEVKTILDDLEKEEGNVDILAVSVNRQLVTVCYQGDGEIESHSVEYKDCDIH